MTGRNVYLLLATIGVAGAAGCVAFQPHRDTPPEGPLPQAFADSGGQDAAPDRWWEALGSEKLNLLVEEALGDNLTLRQAWARLEQADAAAAQVTSAIYPTLSVEAGASYDHRRTTVHNDTASFGTKLGQAAASSTLQVASQSIGQAIAGDAQTTSSGGTSPSTTSSTSTSGTGNGHVRTETKQFNLGLAASYEVDLWGKIASQRQAAVRDVLASREDLETTAMTVAAEVTIRWLNLQEQKALLVLLAEQLETNRTYLDLVELRFRKSMVSALDVYQQRQAVAQIQTRIPLIKARTDVLGHQLAVLLGRPPGSVVDPGLYDLADVPALPAVGLPADLLAARPDIRAAMARLQSADYSVAVAKADRLPELRLTGQASYSAGELDLLFDDWLANLAAGLTAPLFDGHRRKAEVRRQQAIVAERLANYRLVVYTAIEEVDDALVNERRQREYIVALQQQLDAASSALREASQRYQKGLNDYLPVLSALQTVQQLTQNVITARRELLVYRVNLYRALGGSWTSTLPAPVYEGDNASPKRQSET